MLSGLAVMVVLWIQTPEDGRSASASASIPVTKPAPAPTSSCKTPVPTEPGEVVVCAERPNGYRIDPDVLAAERIKKNPKGLKPAERHVDNSCQTVGPMGCRGAVAIDLLGAGVAIAKMADKISKGASVGSLFATTPNPSEYELYLQAKREREAREEAEFEASAVKASKAHASEPPK